MVATKKEKGTQKKLRLKKETVRDLDLKSKAGRVKGGFFTVTRFGCQDPNAGNPGCFKTSQDPIG